MTKLSKNNAKNHSRTRTALTVGLGAIISSTVLTAGAVSASAYPAPMEPSGGGTITSITPNYGAAAYIPSLNSEYYRMTQPVTQIPAAGPTSRVETLLSAGTVTVDTFAQPVEGSKLPTKKVSKVVIKDMQVPMAVAHSKAANDMHGRMPSLYRGKYYHADQEPFRLCVAEREGMFTYNVRGGGGNNYYGTYQFSSAFQHGIPYMMAKESRQTGSGLAKEELTLRYKPINTWNRYAQDKAFYLVLNANGKWSGKHHWSGGRWHC